LFYSCCLPKFFTPSYTLLQIWLCRLDWIKFVNFSLVLAHWHALERDGQNKIPWKLSSKLRTSHFITNLKAIVIVFKFEPSSLT
jgi:hypothetical protein